MTFIYFSYLLLIGCFLYGFDKVRPFKIKVKKAEISFSIIIPFRNEAENLPKLLTSITLLEYPSSLFEVIFIDDDSNDHSKLLIKKTAASSPVNIRVIPNKRISYSPKKDAITEAINQSKYEWIITTDADCILPKDWLHSFNSFILENDTLCIAAPVTYNTGKSFLDRFQLLDMLSLQGATIGGFGLKKPFLCNGANLCYKKSIFKSLHGFNGNEDIAGGDDIFFLEKAVKAYPSQVHYLKCQQAIVTTATQDSWPDLLSQRVRWAAKTSAYNNWFGKLTGLVVLLMNSWIVCGLILTLAGVFNSSYFLYSLLIKFCVDFYLIYKTAAFFNTKSALSSYTLAFFIYPFFSTYIAANSIFKGYTWKARYFNK
ncbi:glycosyltransferase family 2 protein [Snuella lapsa]|uniref:Glycosyltransferase n=1 Tax=Snuella lapsa TaxID=870481 RepID=A0ABP6WN72_9FLAO